jgi:hypothetical protein
LISKIVSITLKISPWIPEFQIPRMFPWFVREINLVKSFSYFFTVTCLGLTPTLGLTSSKFHAGHWMNRKLIVSWVSKTLKAVLEASNFSKIFWSMNTSGNQLWGQVWACFFLTLVCFILFR